MNIHINRCRAGCLLIGVLLFAFCLPARLSGQSVAHAEVWTPVTQPAPPGGTIPQPPEEATGYSGSLILEFESDALPDGDAAQRAAEIAALLGVRVDSAETMEALPGWVVVDLHNAAAGAVEAALLAAERSPAIRSAVPDLIVPVMRLGQLFPNDPEFNDQWGLHNTGQLLSNGITPVAGVDINAPEAWSVFHDASTVVVAVMDDGTDYTHVDLDGNIWNNSADTAGNNVDDDGNGFVDDVRGWDFGDDDNNPMGDVDVTPADGVFNPSGHGTSVAGIIGAEGNSGIGVSGVAWSVQLMPVKIFASSGGGTSNGRIINAINYAVANGASISNHSWGVTLAQLQSAGLTTVQSQQFVDSICNAIAAAGAADHLVVAAAGNLGVNNDTDTQNALYPATCPQDNVISVTGIRQTDLLYGNYGATTVDLAAPAIYIRSTALNNRYIFFGGTSAAAPFVAGAAALLRAQNSAMTAIAVKTALMRVRPVTDLTGDVLSNGALYLSNLTTLPVTLSYIHGFRDGALVRFAWTTATEVGSAGFNLLVQNGDEQEQLNPELIPSVSADSLEPTDYQYEVGGERLPDEALFFLQELAIDGALTNHGPYQLGHAYGEQIAPDPIDWTHPNRDAQRRIYLPAITSSARQ